MQRLRASPCIGVCSTTYGDLVCRGCNRFAHEVVQWNAYDEDQRDVIWQRLHELRDGSMERMVATGHLAELRDAAAAVKYDIPAGGTDTGLAYEVLRRLALRRMPLPWAQAAERQSARNLLTRIDREFHNRSLAVYERSFKVPAE